MRVVLMMWLVPGVVLARCLIYCDEFAEGTAGHILVHLPHNSTVEVVTFATQSRDTLHDATEETWFSTASVDNSLLGDG
jgi:hypothetical protein